MSPQSPCSECLDRTDHLKETYPSNATMSSSDDMAGNLRDGYAPVSSSALENPKFFIVDAPHRLGEYDDTVAPVGHLLRELEEARDKIQRSLWFAASSMSPIRKLPMEILLKIFASCSESQHNEYFSISTGPLASYQIDSDLIGTFALPTMELTWVCSFWRNVIQSEPTLWSSMDLASDVFMVYPERLNILREYLLRSSSVSLDLRLRIDSWRTHDDFDRMLFESTARWRRVRLEITDFLWASCATDAIRSQMNEFGVCPTLESLDLAELSYGPDESENKEFLESLTVFPKLTTLRNRGGNGRGLWSSDFRCADFSHLTELYIGTLDEPLGYLFCRLPNLKRFGVTYFRLEGLRDGLEQLKDSHHTSSLLELSKLSVSSDTFHNEAWKGVHIPRLTALALSIREPKSWTDFAALNNVLLNSGCVLQVLRITLSAASEDMAIGFISSHPSVHHLSLGLPFFASLPLFTSSYARLLLSLTYTENNPCLLPNLRTLEVLIPVISRDEEPSEALLEFVSVIAALCHMVESRLGRVDHVAGESERFPKPVSRLESVTLRLREAELFSMLLDGQLQSRGMFDTIKDAGVRVKVSWF